MRISANQKILRHDGDKFYAVNSNESSCDGCAFYCCELEDEKLETYCNPANRTDGKYIKWIKAINTKRPNQLEIDIVYEIIKQDGPITVALLVEKTDIRDARLRLIINALVTSDLIAKFGPKYEAKTWRN